VRAGGRGKGGFYELRKHPRNKIYKDSFLVAGCAEKGTIGKSWGGENEKKRGNWTSSKKKKKQKKIGRAKRKADYLGFGGERTRGWEKSRGGPCRRAPCIKRNKPRSGWDRQFKEQKEEGRQTKKKREQSDNNCWKLRSGRRKFVGKAKERHPTGKKRGGEVGMAGVAAQKNPERVRLHPKKIFPESSGPKKTVWRGNWEGNCPSRKKGICAEKKKGGTKQRKKIQSKTWWWRDSLLERVDMGKKSGRGGKNDLKKKKKKSSLLSYQVKGGGKDSV